MKNTLVFLGLALAVIVFLLILSRHGREIPLVPSDVFHRDVTANAACIACHTPGKQAPLKSSHPPKEECLTCHKFKKGA